MGIELLQAWAPALLLHFVRAAAFFAGQPIFGVQEDSRLLRIVLALALGSMLFWTTGPTRIEVASMLELGALALRETLIGLALGLASRLMTSALTTAGEIIAQEMGFTMDQIINPVTGTSSTAVAQLFEAMAFLLIFQLNLHHDLLLALAWVHQVLPVGDAPNIGLAFERLSSLVADSLHAAMKFAVPVLGIMLLLTTSLVVLGRAVPTINLMEFSYSLRVLIALLAAAWFLEGGAAFLTTMFADFIERTRLLFAPT